MSDKLINESINSIAQKYKIDLLVYFGSYKTEYYHSESDIDIAFLSSDMLNVDIKIKLLEDLIIYHRKSEIDLIDLRTAAPLLRHEIARSGKVLYEKEEGLFLRYSLFYIKRYYELKPVIEEDMKNIGKELMELINGAG